MDAKPIVDVTSYQSLHDEWQEKKGPIRVALVDSVILVFVITGASLFTLPTTSIGYVIAVGLWMVALTESLVITYKLAMHYLAGYYLDASFVLEPLDQAYPGQFKRIKDMRLQIFPRDVNAVTPPQSDLRLRIPISGWFANPAEYITKHTHAEFHGRASICPMFVGVLVTKGMNRVDFSLDELIASDVRHGHPANLVKDVGHKLSTTLHDCDTRVIFKNAASALQLFEETKQIAHSPHGVVIKENLRFVAHLTNPKNGVRDNVRTESPNGA